MKLYLRIKINGKWTFRAACLNYVHTDGHVIDCECQAPWTNEKVIE